ncbi:MAG: hypothetical protein ACRD15_03745, partial [Vicinamibacterales bacterium]
RDALRLQRAGRVAEATAKFYEASGLFGSAQLSASSEAPPPSERTEQQGKPPAPPPQAAPPPTSSQPPSAQPTPAQPAPTEPDQTQKTPPAEAPAQQPPGAAPAPPPVAPITRSPPTPTTIPAPAAEAPAPAAPGEDELRDLVRRYEQALEGRSIDALKRLWPTLTGAQEAAIRKEFQYVRRLEVEINNLEMSVSGATATATFIRRYQLYTLDGQDLLRNSRTILSARRSGKDWIIERMRFEAIQ